MLQIIDKKEFSNRVRQTAKTTGESHLEILQNIMQETPEYDEEFIARVLDDKLKKTLAAEAKSNNLLKSYP